MESMIITPKDFADLTELFFWFTFAGTLTALFVWELFHFGISALFGSARRDKELRSDDEAPSRPR